MEEVVDDVLSEINDVLLRRQAEFQAKRDAALREQRRIMEDEHARALEALRAELDAKREKLEKSLALQLDGLHARVDEAEAQRREADLRAARFEGEFNALSESRTLLENRVASLEGTVQTLQSALEATETEAAELREAHAALTLQAEGLTAQLEAAEGRLAGAAEAMTTAQKAFVRGLAYLRDEAPTET
jgi:chromosome segregation ATPase